MSSEKPNFLSQPVVKNVFMFRNGDPYFEARRIVINEKRVCNFETLLREVTGGIHAPFGAVRNIYTPRGGHRVEQLESLQSGEQYVAAGKERFKKLDYLQIGTRRKRMMQAQPLQARPLPPNRIIVSARFLKPIREPCTIFVVANGDTFNPAIRLLIHQRMMGRFDKILEMITEKMGLRVLGGVRSLYTYEGHQVTDGNKLECGQLYVAVGRERFKKLPYSDILFTRPKGARLIKGMKAYSLPPIYRFSKQSRSSKSPVRSSDSGDGESKDSPPNHSGNSSKEHLSSTVREISQARLRSIRTRRSGQNITAGTSDNDDLEPKVDDGNTDGEQEQKAEANSDVDGEQKATTENAPEDSYEESVSVSQEDKEENQETNVEKEGKERIEAKEQNNEKERGATAENEQDIKEEVKVKVTEESKDEVNSEEQESNGSSDKTQGNEESEDEPNASSETEKEQDNNKDEDKQEEDSGNREESSSENVNDAESGEEQKGTENSSGQEKTQSDNEKKESDDGSRGSTNQQEDEIKTKEETTNEPETEKEESKVNEEVRGGSDEADSGAEQGNKDSDS